MTKLLMIRTLSDLVRQVLPRPSPAKEWRVELVDDIASVTADRFGDPVVRVHKTWRESIYNAGFGHVTCHYPLGLEFRGNQDVVPLRSAKLLELWRGKAIRQVYWDGAFTGQLRLVPVFVARTFDGLGVYADHKAECAAKGALTARRSKLKQEQLNKRHIATLRQEAYQIIRRRLESDGRYTGDYRVALAPYKTLLPLAEFLARDADTAPLIVLENECVDAVLHMKWDDAQTLFNQLADDVSRARASFAQPKEDAHAEFSADEESLLAEFFSTT
jgi:hypothetical protein